MQPEIPGVSKFILADSSNYTTRPDIALRTGRPYDEVVIHCTDGHERAQPVAEMFATPQHDGKHAAAHVVIGQDAEAIQCVPLRCAAYHAHGANSHSVGIEHCARTPGELYRGDPGLKPTQVQYRKSAYICAWVLAGAGLVPKRGVNIKGHAEADPTTTHTRCPDGCGWDWDLYMSMVNEEYAKLVGPPAPLVA